MLHAICRFVQASLRWLEQFQWLGMALLLGVALVTATNVLAGGLLQQKLLERSQLRITGLAQQFVEADTAVWRLHLSSSGYSTKSLSDALEKDKRLVKAALLKAGLPANALTEESQELRPQYVLMPNGTQTNQVSGYELHQYLTVHTPDVKTVAELAANLQAFYDQGVNLSADSPQYFYNKLEELKPELIQQATENAQKRAASVANPTGSHVGKLVEANTGVFQITPSNSTEVSDYGTYDTSTIEKKITAVVNVTFALN
ncbi:MAG: SIMPL domain-containing protein [Vampirovibrionales bacterium]